MTSKIDTITSTITPLSLSGHLPSSGEKKANTCEVRMTDIEKEKVDDWESLVTTLDGNFKHFNGYIFRGQADAEWKLESTLSRALKSTSLKSKEREQLENAHLTNFKVNLRGRSNYDLGVVSDDELWALGQHFGLYTPLLDWTRSPYVALYFSLFGKCESGYRVIWALLESDIETLNARIKNPNKRVRVVNPLTNYNQRLVNQRGLFVKVPVGMDLEKWVKPSESFTWVSLYKISFPDKIRNDALAALDSMNINYLSLFPDITGSSLYTNYQLEIEPFLEVERENTWKRNNEMEKLGKELLREIKKTKKNNSKPSPQE